MYTIYMFKFPNGKVYIGQTKMDVKIRWKNGNSYNKMMVGKAIKKYGWDNIEKIILCENLSPVEADFYERWYIGIKNTMAPNGYNLQTGGSKNKVHSEESKLKMSKNRKGKSLSEEHRKKISETNKCRTHSEETKKKISENNIGKHQYFLGKSHNELTKKKISEANKGNTNWLGRTHSEETKKKISEVKKGKQKSEEHRNKLSEALKGKKCHLGIPHSDDTKKKMSEKRKQYWKLKKLGDKL